MPTHGNGNTEPLDRVIPAIENLFDFDNNSARSLRPTWRSAHQRSCSKTNAVACTKMIRLGRQMREPDGRLLQLVPHDRAFASIEAVSISPSLDQEARRMSPVRRTFCSAVTEQRQTSAGLSGLQPSAAAEMSNPPMAPTPLEHPTQREG